MPTWLILTTVAVFAVVIVGIAAMAAYLLAVRMQPPGLPVQARMRPAPPPVWPPFVAPQIPEPAPPIGVAPPPIDKPLVKEPFGPAVEAEEKEDIPEAARNAKQPLALTRALDDPRLDALPKQALVRLGTGRLQHPGRRHIDGVNDLRYSGDGKWLASAGGKSIRIWSAASGKEVLALEGHGDRVTRLAFIPGERWMPPQMLISAGADKTIRFWDLNTGQELPKLINHPGAVLTLDVSANKDLLATGGGGGDANVFLWRLSDGKEVRRWKAHHAATLSVAFSPDGKTLATGGAVQTFQGPDAPPAAPVEEPNTFALWDVASGQRVRAFPVQSTEVRNVVWGRSGKFLAMARTGKPGSVEFWDPDSGRQFNVPSDRPWEAMDTRAMALAANGKLLVGLGPVGIVFWDTRSFAVQRGLQGTDAFRARALAVSPDGATLATGSDEGEIALWDVAQRTRRSSGETHAKPITSVGVSPDGALILSTSEDGTARLWDRKTGKHVRTLRLDQPRGGAIIRSGVFAPVGSTLALAHLWEGVSLWNYADATMLKHMPLRSNARISGLSFSGDGKTLAWGDLDNAAHGAILHDIDTNEQRELPPPPGRCIGTALSSDGRLLVYLTGTATVLEIDSGRQLWTSRDNENLAVFSPCSSLLAKNNYRSIAVVDAMNGRQLCRFERKQQDHEGKSLAFSPDGRLLAFSDGDQLRVVEIATNREHAFQGHRGPVTAVAFSPDGKALVTGSTDSTGLVWDMTGVLPAKTSGPVESLWEQLKQDGLKGYAAFCELRRTPQETLVLLKKELRAPADKSDTPRRLLAIKLLEAIATPDAGELLDVLAKDSGEPSLSREAKSAHTRLQRRSAKK